MNILRDLSDDELTKLHNFDASELNTYLLQLQIAAGLSQDEANRYIANQLARVQE